MYHIYVVDIAVKVLNWTDNSPLATFYLKISNFLTRWFVFWSICCRRPPSVMHFIINLDCIIIFTYQQPYIKELTIYYQKLIYQHLKSRRRKRKKKKVFINSILFVIINLKFIEIWELKVLDEIRMTLVASSTHKWVWRWVPSTKGLMTNIIATYIVAYIKQRLMRRKININNI